MSTVKTIPQALDLQVYCGDQNRMLFALTSGGAPTDLSGATITAQARADRKYATPLGIAATVDPTDLPNGQFALEWDGEQLRTLVGDAGTWSGQWDLEVQASVDVLPKTVVSGLFTAIADVTKVTP